jgi:hypothetical protein
MLLSAFFGLMRVILYNWYIGCYYYYSLNDKCGGEPTTNWLQNVLFFNNTCEALSEMFYFHGHFLFAYRYLESAEMLGRKD